MKHLISFVAVVSLILGIGVLAISALGAITRSADNHTRTIEIEQSNDKW